MFHWQSEAYAEGLEVVHGNSVSEKVEESILEHAAVSITVANRLASKSLVTRRQDPIRENKSVTVGPVGVLGVELHELVEENVGHRGHAHGRTGVAGVCLCGGIDLSVVR